MIDKELEHQANKALDKSTREISPSVRQGLYEARQAALSAQNKTWFRRPIVGFAIAASFSAILLVNYLPTDLSQESPSLPQVASHSPNSAEFDDFMFLASFDETDIAIAEDLEFAFWLSEQLEDDSNIEILSDAERRNG
jgi:hypothetical protein